MMDTLKRWERWITIGAAALALAGSIIGAVWAASGDRAAVKGKQDRHATVIDDHEQRLRMVEATIPTMAENVRLTREAVERMEKRTNQ